MPDGIGIYLGAQSIDLVQIAGTFRAPRIVATQRVDLDQPLTEEPERIATLTPALQRLLRQNRLTAPEAHIGFSADTAIIRYFQMPTVPPQDRANAARFEAKKYHPFKLQDLNADAQIVMSKTDPATMRVMFYAAKKEFVAECLRALERADIQARSLETNLTGLMRVVRRTRQLPPQQAAVLITIDRDTATLAVIQHDLVYLARNVSAAPAAGSGTSVPPEAARPAAWHEALVNDTAVSADYYRRRFPNEPPITKVFVNGRDVPAAWLRELSAAVELPVEPLEAGRGLVSGPSLTGNAATAFGVALRALEPGQHAVNLMPQELRPTSQGWLRLVALESVAAAAILGVLYQLNAQPVRRLTGQLAALQPPEIIRTLGLSQTDLTPERLQQRNAELAAEAALVRDAAAATVPAANLFEVLANAAPDTLWLRRLAYRHPSAAHDLRDLTLEGSAYHEQSSAAMDAVNIYASALNRDEAFHRLFGTLSVTSVQRNPQAANVTDFRMVSAAAPGNA